MYNYMQVKDDHERAVKQLADMYISTMSISHWIENNPYSTIAQMTLQDTVTVINSSYSKLAKTLAAFTQLTVHEYLELLSKLGMDDVVKKTLFEIYDKTEEQHDRV